MRGKPVVGVPSLNHEGNFLEVCPCNVCQFARSQGVTRDLFNDWIENLETEAGPGRLQEHAADLVALSAGELE